MKYNFKPSELTKEKNLWDVYLLYRRVKPSPFNVCVVLAVYALLLANSFCLEKDAVILLNDVRNWATMGFNFAITTLGFLIAGFTIFATLAKPEMLLAMMDHTNKETDLPTLKYNFVLFMGVFISYIFFAFAYASIMFFGQKGGLFSNILRLTGMGAPALESIIRVTYSLTGASVVFLLLILKTFIFNIYHIVMNSLRWEHLELKNKEENNMKKIEQLDDSTKNGIIRWTIDFLNTAYHVSGMQENRKPDIPTLLNLLKSDLPEGLIRDDNKWYVKVE